MSEFSLFPSFLRETPGSQLPSNWKVYIGLVSQLHLPSPYFVKQIILHENYDPETKNNDIALLKLDNPASEFIHKTHTKLQIIYFITQVHYMM